MSDDIKEAIGAILGIAFAGIVLAMMGSEMKNENLMDLQLVGGLMVVFAIVAAAALLYATLSAVMSR